MTATASRPAATSVWKSPVLSYYLLATSTGILLLVGLAVVLSSTSIYSIRQEAGNPWTLFLVQVVALAIGLLALVWGSRRSVAWWKGVGPIILLSSMALLVLVALRGVATGGNKNWIRIANFTMQPSEIAKLGLALYLGSVLAMFRSQLVTVRRIMVPAGAVALVVMGLVMLGRDLGTTLILMFITATAFWVAGLPVRFFVTIGSVVVLAVTLLVLEGNSRVARLTTWLSPTCDPTDECLQQTHGTWALASGGLWGLGPGMSREKWGYLPAADNDFIFAIVGEEFGLIGTLLVVLAFGMMIVAVNRMVQRHTDPFVRIAAAGLGAWIIGQALVNIAVVLELLPVTGVPLPLVSSGGTSLIMSLTAMGVLMAFARNEPGAREAFAARPSVVRRSLAVLGRGRRG